ncbi:MAG: hypothetical protein K5662_01060 [Lachnospiraceae bacterium]|nr:hypothetical protein [Lachnospiraceae bacterium]
MNRLGIIAIGYNRTGSMRRLLEALSAADYGGDCVTLIISIDHSGNDDVYELAEGFVWPHGEKAVEYQSVNLGLRKHIIKCGSYMEQYDLDAVAVFEDDILPAKGFYNYMKQTVDYYYDDEKVAGISLYTHLWNYQKNLPFDPVKGRYDVYFMNMAQSWGQVWLRNRWKEFMAWYEENKDRPMSDDVPATVRKWPESSWLKYHIAYCIEEKKVFVYPYTSFSTCFADEGVHTLDHTSIYQVPMNMGCGERFNLIPASEGDVFYDAFFEYAGLGRYLSVDEEDLCVSIYGARENTGKRRYLLSKKDLPYKVMRSFALECRPHEMNVILGIEGDQIKLYDTSVTDDTSKERELVDNSYYFRFNRSGKWMIEYAVRQKMRTLFKGGRN